MPLHLYRRHRRECEGGHPEESRSGELEERRKGWKRCSCPIFASGTLNRKFRRQTTGCWQWEDARATAQQWDTRGGWDTPAAAGAVEAVVTSAETSRITVEHAVKGFTAEFGRYAAANTRRTYGFLLKRLEDFSQSHGYVMIDQWRPGDVREFRASWDVSAQTAAKMMSTVRTFFEFCLANEWIQRNPAKLVRNQRARDAGDRRNDQKLPFSDEELQRMYEACATRYGKQEIKWSRTIHHHRVEGEYARYNTKWTGEDLADFIAVSVHTGLRISDVATFCIDRMNTSGEIRIRTTKAGTHVHTWVPKWLQQRIRERAERIGPYIFGEHRTKDLNVITDVWRRKLKNLWKLCGSWKDKPTPHRFRHTFARVLLQRGVTIQDVADLLGNSEAICRRYYAAWIPERQQRLTRILQDAFDDRPRPKLVEMPS
jgi:site-specific recombinase XerD